MTAATLERPLQVGGLFFGYGGLDMAVSEVLGAQLAWVSEIDEGACKVIAHRHPGVPNHGDITTIDWSTVAGVDVLTAGFPCQDVSAAGKRAGLHAGTRTGLWHHTARAIDELRPSLVVLENVRGLLSARGDAASDDLLAAWAARDLAENLIAWLDSRHARAAREGRTDDARRLATRRLRIVGLRKRAVARARRADAVIVRAVGTVLGALADLGFDAEWFGLRAADVGAPHGRWRIFILAWPADAQGLARILLNGDGPLAALAQDVRHERSGRARDGRAGSPHGDLLPTPLTTDGKASGPGDLRRKDPQLRALSRLLPTPTTEPTTGNGHARNLGAEAKLMPTPTRADHDASGGSSTSAVTLTDAVVRTRMGTAWNTRLLPTPRAGDGEKGGPNQSGSSGDLMLPSAVQQQRWGVYALAVALWAEVTRPAPAPTEPAPKGGARLSARFSEWMMGIPDGHVTDVPGITRNEALKLCGNGVVPQQAAHALRVMLARLAAEWVLAA